MTESFKQAPAWLTPNVLMWCVLIVVAYGVLLYLGRKLWRLKSAEQQVSKPTSTPSPKLPEKTELEFGETPNQIDSESQNPIEKLLKKNSEPPTRMQVRKRFFVWLVLALGGHFMLVQELLK